MPSSAPMFRAHGNAEQAASHDTRRGSARERGYTAQWERSSLAHRRLHPLCVGCEAVGRVVACDLVDHVDPHKGDMVRFWDAGNWQSSCRWHHDVVKQQLEQLYARGLISAADLRLDSAVAIALTRKLDPARG